MEKQETGRAESLADIFQTVNTPLTIGVFGALIK